MRDRESIGCMHVWTTMASQPVASLLWRSKRIYQIFGANTDVGKTIFTTLLCKAVKKLWANEPVTFLKPVSTGADNEADDRCKFLHGLLTGKTRLHDLYDSFSRADAIH